MPNITAPAFSLPTKAFPTQQSGAPAGVVGELAFSEVLSKYATLVKAGKVFYTSAIITAPAIFTATAQFGPMIWNKPASNLDAHILAVMCSVPTTAFTTGGALGYASVTQPTAPATATAIVAQNAYAGGGPSAMGAINSTATVLAAPVPLFLPLIGITTAAITVPGIVTSTYVDVGGAVIIGPGNVGYIAGSATMAAGVVTIGLLWAELPA